MERPGLLELAVYALVLTAAAGWVYALPPFTRDLSKSQSAETQPAAATETSGSEQSAAVTEVSSQESAAAQSSTASAPDDQPPLDPRPDLLVVTARSLNMRAEPNAGSALVGSYPRGALVEKVETSGNWVLVRPLDDESTGWMYAGYLGAIQGN